MKLYINCNYNQLQLQQITIEDENQYRICGYENEIIKEIVKVTRCQVHVNRFPREKEMTAATVINSLANVSLTKYN